MEKSNLMIGNCWQTEQGNSEAQYIISDSYYVGHDVPKDDSAVVMWCWKATKQGYARAQYKLCLFYIKGDEIRGLLMAYL